MNKKIARSIEKLVSAPHWILTGILGAGRIKAAGFPRWESNVRLKPEDGEIHIGKNSHFRSGVRLHTPGGVIRIGEYAFMSYNVSITGYKTGSVVIEDDVWIGANCVILKDTHIGRNCVIAAGSVVKGNIPARTVWGPSLATRIKEF